MPKQPSPPETINLDKLRTIAKSRGPIRNAAKAQLSLAESLQQQGRLGSILVDRHLRHIQVYSI